LRVRYSLTLKTTGGASTAYQEAKKWFGF
jgi:hypothetical protein